MPVATVYLFCRTVDELADERAYEIGREAALDEAEVMRAALEATLAGAPPAQSRHEFLWRRLAEVHDRFALDPLPLHQQIDGAEWDLRQRPINTDADLLAYSDLVAGSVGALVLPFLLRRGAERAPLDRPARALGVAFQITNILRDVGEDARALGRVYLPADRLAAAGITPEALAAAAGGADLGPLAGPYREVTEALMQKAEALYDEAEAGIALLRPGARWAIRTALRTYRDILNEVRARGYDNLTQRAWVPTGRKVRLALVPGYARRRQRLGG